MKKEKTISIKISEKDYDEIKQKASKDKMSISAYIRSHASTDISNDWIKKTTVQKTLSRVAFTLDKYEEKNNHLTNEIRKELNVLWEKL